MKYTDRYLSNGTVIKQSHIAYMPDLQCCCIGLKGLKELLSNQGAILPDFSAFILIILIHIYCTFVPRHFLDPFKMQLYSCSEPN